ncbi:hypothetical protein [Sphingobacterium sp. SGG-5]|uniref:hypothetical protein n=1 Tax=Sphingobacterium sp. SGG-5 TaxID=2710881 RepID=UPI0019CFBEB1|nr:hypothetical protein [Sphingobacterium sp. SGG-5]
MKKPFNTIGVAQVQAQILALPASEKAAELQALRTDFVAWMHTHFDLSPSEQADLSSLPATFCDSMAQQVADVLEEGGLFSFFKEEQDDTAQRGEPRGKDILLQPVRRAQYSFDDGTLTDVRDLSIAITYR